MSLQEAQAHKDRGNQYFKQKNYEQAIVQYTKAIVQYQKIQEIDPKNSIFFSNRSRSYKIIGNLQKSFQDAQKSIQLDEKNIKGYFLMGETLVSMAQGSRDPLLIEKAIEKLRKSLTLCPSQDKVSYEERFVHEIYKAKKKLWELKNEKNIQKKKLLRKYLTKLVESDKGLEQVHKQQMNQKIEKLISQNIATEKPKIPESLICYLSKSLIRDPMCNQMGNTYSKIHYLQHLKNVGKIDPLTKKVLKYNLMYPNLNLKKAIEHFLQKNPWAYEETQ